jgi:hypothetical protein
MDSDKVRQRCAPKNRVPERSDWAKLSGCLSLDRCRLATPPGQWVESPLR